MPCEYDHAVCYGVSPSASDSASVSVRELYRRPTRRRFHRHVGRRRLLHQHISCPNNFFRSDEVTSTSADELSAWSWRRTRSDLPPMGAACYKTAKSRHSLRPPPATRRGTSRHRRTTTIVHHPCCLVDPKLCPVMKGSHHRQRLRPGEVDSETLRETEELRTHIESHIESYLYQQPRHMQQKSSCQPDATKQMPGAMPQHQSKQMKSAQQCDPRDKKCKLCGNTQRFSESATQYAQCYLRQPPAGQLFPPTSMLTPEVSSETADRLVDELSRRSAGPRPAHTPQRFNIGDVPGQQRNPASAATTNSFPTSLTAGLRKGDAGMTTDFKLGDIGLIPPLADINHGHITMKNMPQPRNTASSPFKEEYYSRNLSHVLEHGKEVRPSSPIKTGPPMTQIDLETSFTMQSFASARAATTKNPDNENTQPQRYNQNGAYTYEEVARQPENVKMNFQQTTRRAASDGAKPSGEMVFPPSPSKGVFALAGQDPDDSRNKSGQVDPEIRIMPQSEQDSARFTAGTYETDISELQQIGNHTAATETSSSNGDYQTDNETPVVNGSLGSLRHMDGVKKALKSWHASSSDPVQAKGVHSQPDILSSPGPSTCRESAAGDVNHLPGCQRASSQASPSSRKSVLSPTSHRGDGNHQESDVRKSGNTSHNNLNVVDCDDSAVCSRHSYVTSHSKPDDCESQSNRSFTEQGDMQQEAARSISHSGAPTLESGCKSTPNAEDKATASSRASRNGSTISSAKTSRRRPKDRGDGDAKAIASESNDVNSFLAVNRQLSMMEQLDLSRRKIAAYIDKALAILLQYPVLDLNESGSQPKLQSADQFVGRSKSVVSDSSDLEPQRECSSMELSSELWSHLDATIKDSLASISQQHASKGAGASSGEDLNNRKLLMKLRRDVTKNILTNLKRLEDIESLLHTSNDGRPSNPPSK